MRCADGHEVCEVCAQGASEIPSDITSESEAEGLAEAHRTAHNDGRGRDNARRENGAHALVYAMP